QRLSRLAPPEQEKALADTQEAVRTSLEEVRRIAQELRPEALDHLGLASALTSLSRRFSERTGIAVRRSFQRELPALDPAVELVAEAVNGAEAVERGLEDDIDLAILDISMERKTGLQAAAELRKRRPELRVLILSMYDNEQFLFEALKAGAAGYVLKSGADGDIVNACRAAMRGEPFLYPSAVHALIRDMVTHAGERSEELELLTPRELEVL